MREYFLLTQGKDLVSLPSFLKIQPGLLKRSMTQEDFDQLDELMVGYFNNHTGIELSDILEEPAFMISTQVKNLFQIYDEEVAFKAVQLFSLEDEGKTAPLYWLPNLPTYSCLHSLTEYFGTGTLKELILDKEKIGDKDIFRVGGIMENRVVVSLAVAESLLRREFMGVGLEHVKVR